MEFHGNTVNTFGMATFFIFNVEQRKHFENFDISRADETTPSLLRKYFASDLQTWRANSPGIESYYHVEFHGNTMNTFGIVMEWQHF